MKSTIILAIFLVSFTSCKKETIGGPPPGNPNNQVSAIVSEKGAAGISFNVNGNNTVFARRTEANGDIVVTVMGSNGKSGGEHRSIQLTLINSTSSGTYSLDVSQASSGSFCDYTIGSVFFSPIFEIHSTRSMTQIGGTVTIEAISPTSIKGTFNANCNNIALITNGHFKGTFEK